MFGSIFGNPSRTNGAFYVGGSGRRRRRRRVYIVDRPSLQLIVVEHTGIPSQRGVKLEKEKIIKIYKQEERRRKCVAGNKSREK